MKEATGELNMTVVTIVAIGAIVAFFYLLIWPNIEAGLTLQSACSSAGNSKWHQDFDDGKSYVDCTGSNPNVCSYYNGSKTVEKECNKN